VRNRIKPAAVPLSNTLLKATPSAVLGRETAASAAGIQLKSSPASSARDVTWSFGYAL
jgi:hypothetical protein